MCAQYSQKGVFFSPLFSVSSFDVDGVETRGGSGVGTGFNFGLGISNRVALFLTATSVGSDEKNDSVDHVDFGVRYTIVGEKERLKFHLLFAITGFDSDIMDLSGDRDERASFDSVGSSGGVGFSYFVGKDVSFDVGYRYSDADVPVEAFTADANSGIQHRRIFSHRFLIGLSWYPF